MQKHDVLCINILDVLGESKHGWKVDKSYQNFPDALIFLKHKNIE